MVDKMTHPNDTDRKAYCAHGKNPHDCDIAGCPDVVYYTRKTNKPPPRVEPIVWTIPHEDGGPIDVISKEYSDKLQAELDEARIKNQEDLEIIMSQSQRIQKAEALLRELESKIVFNSENQSKIDRYFAEVEGE